MKYIARLSSGKHLTHMILAGSWLVLSGCVTCHEDICVQFEQRRQETDYGTRYRFSEFDSDTAAHNFKPMPRGAGAVVRLYKMDVDEPEIRPCHDLTIHKEIYLQRTAATNMVIEEIREFYTANGTLIASKTEVLSNQLRTSGYYFGEMLLPIPQGAPPGKYRLVSRLVMKPKGNNSRTVLLARTGTSFQVLAADKK